MRAGSARTASADAALRRAHRLLLETPVIGRDDRPDDYLLARRHAARVREWHAAHTGWTLYVGGRTVRLLRRPDAVPAGAWERWQPLPFASARDYACLVWILWYARSPLALGTGTHRQFLLSRMALQLMEQAGEACPAGGAGGADPVSPPAPAPRPLDFVDSRADRLSLVRALRALIALGAIRVMDGRPEGWADAADAGDAASDTLFEFTETATALIVGLDPARLGALPAAVEATYGVERPPLAEPGTPAQGAALRRAWRALLLGPALLRRDDPAALAALRRAADPVGREARDAFGLALELTATYARLVRHEGGEGPERGPDAGAVAPAPAGPLNPQRRGLDQAALALCGAARAAVLAGRLPPPDGTGCLLVPWDALLGVFREVRNAAGANWGKDLQQVDPAALLGEICGALATAGLARGPGRDGRVLLLPTAACYSVSYADPGGTGDAAVPVPVPPQDSAPAPPTAPGRRGHRPPGTAGPHAGEGQGTLW